MCFPFDMCQEVILPMSIVIVVALQSTCCCKQDSHVTEEIEIHVASTLWVRKTITDHRASPSTLLSQPLPPTVWPDHTGLPRLPGPLKTLETAPHPLPGEQLKPSWHSHGLTIVRGASLRVTSCEPARRKSVSQVKQCESLRVNKNICNYVNANASTHRILILLRIIILPRSDSWLADLHLSDSKARTRRLAPSDSRYSSPHIPTVHVGLHHVASVSTKAIRVCF